jgi:hypothetical protein
MAGKFDNSLSKSRLAKRGSSWSGIVLINQCSTNAYGNRYTAPAVTRNHHHAVNQKRNQQNADPHTGTKMPRCVFYTMT